MSLSEQDRERLVAYFLRGSEGGKLVEMVEALIARHVTAALDEAAAEIDGMGNKPFIRDRDIYAEAAQIVRTHRPT